MRRGPLALSAASILLLSLTAVSCDDGGDGIDLAEVGRADVVEVVDAPAAVVATAAATLTAVADGTLAELRVGPGTEVTEGQVLAVIDSPGAHRRLEQAGEALALASQATAVPSGGAGELTATQDATDEAAGRAFDQARQAADQLADDRLREALQAQVDAAREQYEMASAAARAAVRSVQQGVASLGSAVAALGAAQRLQAEQAYELAEATVGELTLRAPFDGTVQLGGTAAGGGSSDLLGDLLGAAGAGAAAGDAAAAGDLPGGLPAGPGGSGPPPGVDPVPSAGAPVSAGTAMLTVVDVTELGAVAQVDETDVLLVEPGVGAEVELDAAPGARYPATVTAVDLLPTPSARGGVAYGVRLTLQAGRSGDGTAAPSPRPGMSAVAHLRVGEAVGTVAVPAAAVLRVADADVVWAVQDGQAVRIPVTLGVQGRDVVEIVSGLRPGDRIVVRGADRVTEGQRLP
ncbi:MAG: HlyD family efflux transporter periplasmic adaptor subunit [Micromonosporaceae bacterium]|nr:HlyD family efflux transporter periplasmic adaptor subunit [Micromonosporaceae bacterium]